MSNLTSDPRPSPAFADFYDQLEDEIAWIAELHRKDRTGRAAADQASLRRLQQHVRSVSQLLGFGDPAEGAAQRRARRVALAETLRAGSPLAPAEDEPGCTDTGSLGQPI